MISSSILSIDIKSRVPVLLLVILNGASKSYTISCVYQNLATVNPVLLAAATITVVCSRNEDENAKVGERL